MGMDLRAPKQRFATLMDDIGPTATSQFVVWLDEKVAEFKVNGNMNFDINVDAPRWIRDYSMSVMLSTAAQQYSDKESEYTRPSERPTPTARRKDPIPLPRPRPRVSRPQSPQLSPAHAESSLVALSRFSEEQTERGHKRLHQEIDHDDSMVHRQREFIDIKRERREDSSCQFDQDGAGDGVNGDGASSDIVKSEPLSPNQPSYELDINRPGSETLRDSTELDQRQSQTEAVQTIYTPGASQLVATAASTGSSIQGASGDDSFQEAILLDDSDDDDSHEGNPDDFMRKIIAYESQHNPDDSSMLQESMDEGVAGPSGEGSENSSAAAVGWHVQQRWERFGSNTVSDQDDSNTTQELGNTGLSTNSSTYPPSSTVSSSSMISTQQAFNEYVFKCMYCSTAVKGLSAFRRHLYEIHLNYLAQEYPCVVCESVVTMKANFVQHCISHYKIFSCPWCDKRFKRAKDVRTHTFKCHGKITCT